MENQKKEYIKITNDPPAQHIHTYSVPDSAGVNVYETFTPENLRNIDIDSTPTTPLAIRVPVEIYNIYKKFTKKQKRFLRKLVAATIIGLEGKSVNTSSLSVILNVNINQNSIHSINNNVIDPQILQKENKILREEKRRLMEIVNYYEGEIKQYKQDIVELEKQLREKDRIIAGLRERIKFALKHPESAEEILRRALD